MTALFEDHSGVLWVGGRGGLSRLVNGRWERIAIERGVTNDAVTGLLEDRDYVMWVAPSADKKPRVRRTTND